MNLTGDDAKRIAHAIAFGHAYEKHAANISESGELLTQSSFESLVLQTLLSPDQSRRLKFKRAVFWNAVEGFLVIFSPDDPDAGTAYWPVRGIDEYKRIR
jgi:hypothetical protein